MHWLCEDIGTGEEILVTAWSAEEAEERMLNERGWMVRAIQALRSWEAEDSGLDEY